MLLFELSTGVDLFPKDLNRDNIVTEADRQALGNWTSLSQEQLELVFKPAVRSETVSVVRRLVTQDLIMLCLCGNSGTYDSGNHPRPSDRPASMEEILQHPFFWKEERLASEIALPAIPLHTGLTDVMLSYRSTEVYFASTARANDCRW